MQIWNRKGKYYLDYWVSGRRIRESAGKNKKLAEELLAIRKSEILQGRFQYKPKQPRTRFEELAGLYLEYSKANKKSWSSDVNSLKFLKPYFKEKLLSEITPFDVEKYKITRANSIKPSSANRELACLKHMFSLAIKWKKADKNPVKEVKLFKIESSSMRILSWEEEKLLLDKCPDYIRPIIITALNTGGRKEEVLSLTWDKVDFETGAVKFEHTKNNESRSIPMNNTLKDTFMDIRLRKINANRKSFVFCRKDGSRFGKVNRGFQAAIKRAGIEHCRFHDLRHTFATRLVMKGVDLATVKELLGHKSIEMTMRYAHPTSGHKGEAVRLLDMVTLGHNPVTGGDFKKTKKAVSVRDTNGCPRSSIGRAHHS